MRLFLLPISTRRTLIYCERVQESLQAGQQQPISERIINRASTQWATWEKAEKGWQKQLVYYGNLMFKRIPFEEWGLKSLPPATQKKLAEVDEGRHKFECLYPGAFMQGRSVGKVLRTLATERQAYHRKQMWTCLYVLPLTFPFTIVPVIPNIPFFYILFRAWSHYRAHYGGKMLEHLTTKNLIQTTDSKTMDSLYAAGLLHPSRSSAREARTADTKPSDQQIEWIVGQVEEHSKSGTEEAMLLQRWNGKLIAEEFSLPEMEIEIERAVEQVEKAIDAKDELQKEKKELESGKAAEQKTEKVEDVGKR